MASTNQTQHYNLSQYVANDKPTYLVDYNGDMSKIDAGIYSAETKALVNQDAIGNLTNLNTQDKSSLVNAVNEVNTQVGTNTGDISNLKTSVSANTGNIGTMANLQTTNKTSLVNAVNEVNSNVGDLTNLNTTDKTSLVNAINEVNSKVDTYSTNEILTNKVWINNKPIYRKVFTNISVNQIEHLDITSLSIDDITDLEYKHFDGTNTYDYSDRYGVWVGNEQFCRIYRQTGNLNQLVLETSYSNSVFDSVIKNPSGIT